MTTFFCHYITGKLKCNGITTASFVMNYCNSITCFVINYSSPGKEILPFCKLSKGNNDCVMIPGPAWEERAQGTPWREGTGGEEGSAGDQGGKIDHLKTVGIEGTDSILFSFSFREGLGSKAGRDLRE